MGVGIDQARHDQAASSVQNLFRGGLMARGQIGCGSDLQNVGVSNGYSSVFDDLPVRRPW